MERWEHRPAGVHRCGTAAGAEDRADLFADDHTNSARGVRRFGGLGTLWGGGGSDSRTRDLAALYRAAAAFEAAEPGAIDAAVPATDKPEDATALVADIVAARIGAGPERSSARDRLQKRLSSGVFLDPLDLSGDGPAGSTVQAAPAWMEAWLRAGIGRSLLRESDAASRRSGAIQLLHVPARFTPVTPELAKLCLTEAIAALRALGDQDAAVVLEKDLAQTTGEFGDWAGEAPEPPTESGGPTASTTSNPATTGNQTVKPQ